MNKKKKKQKKQSPDLNTLFEQVNRFCNQGDSQYRFHLFQLATDSWRALFERMDTTAFHGDVSAIAESPAKAIELALVLVRDQTETEKAE